MFFQRRKSTVRRYATGAIACLLCLIGPAAGPAAVVVSPSPTAAVTSIVVDSSFTNVLVCDWNVDLAQANVAGVVWSADQFAPNKKTGARMNAYLRLQIVEAVGPASAAIMQSSSTTTAENQAVVSAVVSGTGSVRFRTWVGTAETSDLLAEGLYSTVVHAAAVNK